MADPTRYRDRKFCMVLYPEDDTHVECIKLLQTGGYNFGAILHDEDVIEDGEHKGEKKKPHWHVVVRFKNAVWNTSIADQLGIQVNYIQSCKNLDGALLYLVHYGHEDKAQYDLEQVFGSLQTRLASLLADDDESTRALNIYDIIRNSSGIVTYTEVFEKACRSGLYGDFRRMGTGIKYLIDDHNDEFHKEDLIRKGCASDRDQFRTVQKYFRGGG